MKSSNIYDDFRKHCCFFRLYAGDRSELSGKTLLTSAIYTDVIKNNVDLDTSFNRIDISIEKTLNEPNTALFYDHHYLQGFSKHKCKVKCKLIYSFIIIHVFFNYHDFLDFSKNQNKK